MLIDMVPSYASLLVIYDQLATDHLEVRSRIRKVLDQLSDAISSSKVS